MRPLICRCRSSQTGGRSYTGRHLASIRARSSSDLYHADDAGHLLICRLCHSPPSDALSSPQDAFLGGVPRSWWRWDFRGTSVATISETVKQITKKCSVWPKCGMPLNAKRDTANCVLRGVVTVRTTESNRSQVFVAAWRYCVQPWARCSYTVVAQCTNVCN